MACTSTTCAPKTMRKHISKNGTASGARKAQLPCPLPPNRAGGCPEFLRAPTHTTEKSGTVPAASLLLIAINIILTAYVLYPALTRHAAGPVPFFLRHRCRVFIEIVWAPLFSGCEMESSYGGRAVSRERAFQNRNFGTNVMKDSGSIPSDPWRAPA